MIHQTQYKIAYRQNTRDQINKIQQNIYKRSQRPIQEIRQMKNTIDQIDKIQHNTRDQTDKIEDRHYCSS